MEDLNNLFYCTNTQLHITLSDFIKVMQLELWSELFQSNSNCSFHSHFLYYC